MQTACRFRLPTCPGCSTLDEHGLVSSSAIIRPDGPQKHRDYFFRTIAGFSPLDVLLCPAVYRDVLFGYFFQAHFPQSLSSASSGPNSSLVRSLRDLFFARTESMGLAIDALLLRQFGNDTNDAVYIREGETRRLAALHYVRTAIESGHVYPHRDTLLTVIYVLSVYDSESNDTGRDRAYLEHTKGLSAVLSSLGPSSTYGSDLARNVFVSSLPVLLSHAIKHRQAFFMDQMQWQNALRQHLPSRVGDLFRKSCGLPRLMQRLDRLLAARSKTREEAMGLMEQMLALDTEIKTWLSAWYTDESDTLPPPTVPTTATPFTRFLQTQGPLATAFPWTYMFSSPAHVIGHVNYWVLRLHIRQVVYMCSLLLGFNTTEDPALSAEKQRAEADDCADELCRCIIPMTCSPLATVPNPIARAVWYEPVVHSPVLVALEWYESTGRAQKAEWCRRVLGSGTDREKYEALLQNRVLLPKLIAGWTLTTDLV